MVELTEKFLVQSAGWDAVKQARALLDRDKVLSSNWQPPVLKGVVQETAASYRAGLVVRNSIDIENLCSCRASRQWGTICAHSVAIGLHYLRGKATPAVAPNATKPVNARQENAASSTARSKLRRADSGANADPLALSVIIPPNFEKSLEKGKVMVCFEGEHSRGRNPLDALSRTTAFHLSAQDASLLDWIEDFAEGETPAMLLLKSGDFAKLLGKLVDHPRVFLGKSQAILVSNKAFRLSIRATLHPSGEIELALREGQEFPAIIDGEPIWAYARQAFFPMGLPRSCCELPRGTVRLPRQQVPVFLSQDWPKLLEDGDVEANFQLGDFVLEPQPPRFLLHLAGGLARLEARLQCAYGARIMTMGVTRQEESLWLPDPDCSTRYSTRDPGAERSALDRLLRCGFRGPDVNGRYLLVGQDSVLRFFAREFPKMEQEWETSLEERLERSTAQKMERIEPQLRVTASGEQWFDLDVSFASASGQQFSAAEIQRLVLSGQSHTRLPNGKLAVIDTGAVEQLQEVLLDCAPQQHEQGYRLAKAQAGYLETSLQERAPWRLQAPSAWRERSPQEFGNAVTETPPLGHLESVLRPYQKQGVVWMHFLRRNRFGGILADEMGLGKTLQTLALLHTKAAGASDSLGKEASAPTLIVCPTSLIFNWVSEAQRFTPSLKVLAWHGAKRHELWPDVPLVDLVVTSYSLIRRDAELYRQFEFDTVVLDEAQHIKNRQTQNAQAVKAIRSRYRLVLTGTPLENSVLDLWSIFDFLMPGYLGTAKDFRERYEIPITRDKSAEVQARLARRVRPFLLRRMKREVAKELPERIEQVAYCELTEDQRSIYRQVLEAGRKEALEATGERGMQKGRIAALNALLRLRQICCDLRLLQLDNVDPHTASGKLDLFGELLEEVLDGGHRVLVFSQFVTMLKLLEDRLQAERIDYCYLDGSTANRASVVARFQNSAAIPVFLISLKAGGVGLNLTGADTVIHFDPWWNPAVEDQATDRAHRIGQSRVVTSYKLIAQGTVEEKILNLQNRKRSLIQSALQGEEEFTAALSWEEIQNLLANGSSLED